MAFRALVIWFVLLSLATLNGAFREAVLIPQTGSEAGHFISSIMLCAVILVVVIVAAPWIRLVSTSHAVGIGLAWVVLTLIFEFGFGHFIRHQPWSSLLEDYNVLRGRIWVLVLLAIALAPLVAGRVWGFWPRAPF